MDKMTQDFNNPTIDDLEFSKRFSAAVDEAMAAIKSQDQIKINHSQMRKLVKLIAYFENRAKELGGRVEDVSFSPTDPPNGITVDFEFFDLTGDEVQEFCDIISPCSAISMDVTDKNEISISCTIPNVYIYE